MFFSLINLWAIKSYRNVTYIYIYEYFKFIFQNCVQKTDTDEQTDEK